MGLFGDLKSVVKKHAADKVDDAVSAVASTGIGRTAVRAKAMVDDATGKRQPAVVMAWRTLPFQGKVVLEPSVKGKLYVYYPEPLRHVRQGERFLVEAVAGDVIMRSSYSGNEMDTRESDVIAYMYGNDIVGMSSCCKANVRELLERGFKVFVQAEKLGVFDKDIPDIVIFSSWNADNATML